jgi:cytidine deaminase
VVRSYANDAELERGDRELLEKAKQAIGTSYAPYSKFHVGCALLLDNGVVIQGSNQENIAFPSGLCAERVAVFSAGAQYPDVPIIAIAITVKAEDYEVKNPITSCGACLQSMSEYEVKFNRPMRIILRGETGAIWVAEGLKTFMPFMFYVEELGK